MLRTAFAAQFFALVLLAATTAWSQPPHVLDEDAALCRSGHGPAIQVNVSGLKDRAGELWLELYPDTAADFLRDDTALLAEGKTFRRTRMRPVAVGTNSICVRVPHPGRYALLLRHNRTGKDGFSLWSDGVGFPGNRPIGRSRPQFGQAAIDAGAGVTVTGIQMQYMHGLRGFQAELTTGTSAHVSRPGTCQRDERRGGGVAGSGATPPRWTVLIPFFNERDYLTATIASLAAQSEAFELLLVDNGSTDGGRGRARRGPIARLAHRLLTERRPGKVAALQAGLAAVGTRFVATCDADTIYPGHYLREAGRLLDRPGCVAAGAYFIAPDAGAPRGPQRRARFLAAGALLPRLCHAGGAGQCFRTPRCARRRL